jgi:hypothetical protein
MWYTIEHDLPPELPKLLRAAGSLLCPPYR